MGTTEHNRFVDFILPKKTTNLDFSNTTKLLTKLFRPNTTLFHKRWKCLNTVKDNQKDFLTFAASVNRICNDFKLAELTAEVLNICTGSCISRRRRSQTASTDQA